MTVSKIAKLMPIAGLACLLGFPAMAQTAPGAAPTSGTMVPMSSGAIAPAAGHPMHRKADKRALIPSDEKFSTASAAAAHCPNSTVEWTALTRSKAYHDSKSRYFGKTKHGAYACKSDLDAAGFHPARN
ncbi:MAG: hypothetical protein KGJ73_07630 [Rhodospirillales bacterium]|nr:hypothetical protein [Rhodospirillales bacterium]